MFRYLLHRSEVFSFACKIIGRTRLQHYYERAFFGKHLNVSCSASVTRVCSSQIPDQKGIRKLFGSVFENFECNRFASVEMSPSNKRTVHSPDEEIRHKRKHKSKHKREKSKLKHKHEKSKFKHKHKHKHSKHKSKHKHKKHKKEKVDWPMDSIHIRTLGDLLRANCVKISGVNNTNDLGDHDMETPEDIQTSSAVSPPSNSPDVVVLYESLRTEKIQASLAVSPPPNPSDVVVVYESLKTEETQASLVVPLPPPPPPPKPNSSDMVIVYEPFQNNSVSNMNSITKNVLCLEGESVVCITANDDNRSVKSPLVDLTGNEQGPLSKTNHSEPLGIFESGSKMTKLSEIGAGPDKAVQVGETPMQWQHSSLVTADNMRAGNSQGGQCVEPGRYWIYSETVMDDTNKWKKFKLLSYNVLSQSLLEEHPFLYKENNKTALEWNFRRQLLFAEIRNLDADILCLQEVERDHWRIFETELKYFGYRGIYKKRSHKRVDGVAIFYKTKTFTLQEYTSVEFFQPSAPVLNRDNVALVAKLTYNAVPRQSIVVATTHLLFNMNRHDVKLAQTQLLLAEVERYAYAGVGKTGARYLPVIITGDMNFKPFSGVYNFLTKGRLRYEGLIRRNLTRSGFNRWQVNGPVLNTTLLPYWLQVTDSCQHLGIQHLREHGVRDRTKEILHLKIRNSDFCHALKHRRENEWDVESSKLLQSLKPQPSSSQPTGLNGEEAGMEREFPSDRFQTGVLTHPFNLQSAYTDFDNEITTFQDSSWVTVDYIFYSTPKDELEGELALLATYKLPTVDEATRLGRIPNFGSPSDHYPLLVMFGLDSEGKKQHT